MNPASRFAKPAFSPVWVVDPNEYRLISFLDAANQVRVGDRSALLMIEIDMTPKPQPPRQGTVRNEHLLSSHAETHRREA
jgi:hypothetical protein